jgi:hypothetical protein
MCKYLYILICLKIPYMRCDRLVLHYLVNFDRNYRSEYFVLMPVVNKKAA